MTKCNARCEELGGLIAAAERRNFSLKGRPEAQAEARCDKEIARGGERDRMHNQRIQIGGKEQGVGQHRLKRLQHQQFVVQIRTEDPNRLDAPSLFPVQPPIHVLHLIAQPPEVIELALPFRAVLRLGIRPDLCGVLAAVLLLPVACTFGTVG